MGFIAVLVVVSVVVWLTWPPAPGPWTDVDPQAWARRRMNEGTRDA